MRGRSRPVHSSLVRRLPAALLLSIGACLNFTHADQFAVSVPNPDARLCAVCASRPDLRHPPCSSDLDPGGDDQVVVFALRALDLGTRASGWDAGYIVGLDQDCSDRPDGIPVACTPRDGTQTWVHLADGVDNALATQVFYPLLENTGIDVQALLNDSLESGASGMLIIVDGWNGTPNDPQVGARLVSTRAVVNTDGRTAPSWAGDDEWEVFADRWDPEFPNEHVPDTANKTKTAYVADGVLVWDARAIQPLKTLFAAGIANIELDLANVVVFGEISTHQQPRLLINCVLGGVWSAFLASRNGEALAQIATQCDPCATKAATPLVENLLQAAPDMLLPTTRPPGTCDAISLGFLGSYVEARLAPTLSPLTMLPASCPDMPACTP